MYVCVCARARARARARERERERERERGEKESERERDSERERKREKHLVKEDDEGVERGNEKIHAVVELPMKKGAQYVKREREVMDSRHA
jgi:hypothetical protein